MEVVGFGVLLLLLLPPPLPLLVPLVEEEVLGVLVLAFSDLIS